MRGWRSKEAEFRKKINEYDICLLTETKSKKSDRIGFKGYDTYVMNDCSQGKRVGAGGVAILIKKNIKRKVIDLEQCKGKFDACGIRIEGEQITVNFICIYRRPGNKVPKGAWNEIFKNVNPREGIIIAGDFNAHHSIWNCERTDTVGETLLEEFNANDIFIVNHNTKTRLGKWDKETRTLI